MANDAARIIMGDDIQENEGQTVPMHSLAPQQPGMSSLDSVCFYWLSF